MLIFNKQADLKEHLLPYIRSKSKIGFVPTMGALHQGHLSLIANSLKNNDVTVVSIFVNPTQFNNLEDLKKYPRDLEKDVKALETVSEKVIVFAPAVEEMYHDNTVSEKFEYDGLEFQMEGKHRPGHFDGVGTIVKRLLEIIQPTFAYFGEKDFQQLQIVKKMVQKHHLPVIIIGCPIFRENNGLAMSSRNERLSETERNEAGFIYKMLLIAKEKFGTKSANEVKKWIQSTFQQHPMFALEYFEIANEATLKPIERKSKDKKYRAFIAVFVNNVRLIDTILLN